MVRFIIEIVILLLVSASLSDLTNKIVLLEGAASQLMYEIEENTKIIKDYEEDLEKVTKESENLKKEIRDLKKKLKGLL